VLLILPGLFLLTIWSQVSPVVVLERPGVIPAFRRSQGLVRGNGWQVFGVIVVFFLILVVVSAILGAIGNAIGPVGSVIADVIASTFTAPLVALAATVLYFNLRSSKGETTAPAGAVGLREPGQPGTVGPGQPGSAGEPAPGAPPPVSSQPASVERDAPPPVPGQPASGERPATGGPQSPPAPPPRPEEGPGRGGPQSPQR
jgi:hypothetical protein